LFIVPCESVPFKSVLKRARRIALPGSGSHCPGAYFVNFAVFGAPPLRIRVS